MLNQVVLVGRVANELSKENIEGGKSRTILTLAVPRSYKNENGETILGSRGIEKSIPL